MPITNLTLTPDDHVLPCPFCGSADVRLDNTHTACYWVACNDCGAEVSGESFSGGYRSERIPRKRHEAAKTTALAAWNRRAPQALAAPSPVDAVVAEPLFYIWDTRSFVGDSILWWRPKGAGYTINLEEAGTYTAEQCRGNRETDRPVPVEVARKVATTHVIAGRLRGALACDAATKGGA